MIITNESDPKKVKAKPKNLIKIMEIPNQF